MARSLAAFVVTAVVVLVAVPMQMNIHKQFLRDSDTLSSRVEPSIQETTKTTTMPASMPSPTFNINTVDNATSSSVDDTNRSILPPPILATEISHDVHTLLSEATNEHGIKLANLSSVNYSGCCGLGHRLARMANAAWIAQTLNVAMHTFWGYCGSDTEIFQHLFGVQDKAALESVTSVNQHLLFRNDLPFFRKLERDGPTASNVSTCMCREDQVSAHYDFYKDLRNHFRYKQQVDTFVNTTFAGHTVLGMHIRAGNGEQGDFTKKKRGIDNMEEWIQQASLRIKELVQEQQWDEPPLLYIATDTPSMIGMFRTELKGIMPVVEFPQERRCEGDGIFFGEPKNAPKMTNQQCIRQWENAVADMILLSHADVLIAGRMSSFVQTMPMSLVFGRSHSKVSTPKCELNLDASKMVCSKTYLQWCCEVRNPRREAINVPDKNFNMSLFELQDRPPFRPRLDSHFPYYWKTQAYEKKMTHAAVA